MHEQEYQEVDFRKYCKTCQYQKLKETEHPCDECLEEPINQYTSKPVHWKEKSKK